MKEEDGVYEYAAVYVDDLCIAAKDPKGIINLLSERHGFKFKGSGLLNFHLRCDYFRDDDGVLCFALRK